jgi:hypothetical protein
LASRARTAYPSGAHDFTPGFKWGSCYSIFSFMRMFCRSLFVLLYFFFWPLCCLFFLRFTALITPLLALSVVDHGFEPRSGLTKNYKIGMCCFSAKHAALRRKSKHWLAQNQDIKLCPSGATVLSAICCFSELAR